MPRDSKTTVRKTPTPGAWRRRLALMILVALVAGATWALLEFVVWNRLPAAFVGRWEVVSGSERGSVIEFRRNGGAVARLNINDKLSIAEAQVRVEDDMLHWTTRSADGMELKRTKLIRTLNSNELIWEERNGQLLTMKRLE